MMRFFLRRDFANSLCSIESIFGGSSLSSPVQTKNLYVLHRRWPPGLTKIGKRPTLKGRHYVYDLIENTEVKKRKNISVVLTSYVSELGEVGDQVSVNPLYAYYKLLLLGKAVYATPENIEKFKNQHASQGIVKKTFSSSTAERTLKILSQVVVSVVMNKDVEWVMEPWHIRMSFRKAGFIVPEHAIEMPQQPIRGPDLNIEGKQFFVRVTVNSTERVLVQCRLHHWSTKLSDRLPYVEKFWEQSPDPLFPEQLTTLQDNVNQDL